jgi:hypothetical protein
METMNIPTIHEPSVAPERAAAFLALSRKAVLKTGPERRPEMACDTRPIMHTIGDGDGKPKATAN